MVHMAPGDWKKRDTCAASIAMLAPSSVPLSKTQGSDRKPVGAVGELEHGP